VLASAGAREVMTAAALLVVLGAALLMEVGGLSMAMGAFVAGVLLSESSFRHQLEADIEPFRGILLGLFFLAVGMSLDLGVLRESWQLVLIGVVAFTVIKSLGIYIAGRLFGGSRREALNRVSLFAQGGEFAFVLYASALDVGIFDAQTNAVFTAIVILSMAITPVNVLVLQRLMPPPAPPSLDGIERPDGLEGEVLIIGFGRFGQVVSQSLLARGFEVSIIEANVAQVRNANAFGFKVYYGDGTRLATLRASGAETARAIIVCVNDRAAATRIVELVKSEFPLATVLARAYDRGHAIKLMRRGVDFQLRETFASAMMMGRAALMELGVPPEEVEDIIDDVRRRDEERLQLQIAGGLTAGRDLVHSEPVPTPLTRPRRTGQVIEADGDQAGEAATREDAPVS
jgi:glutathione-regulated potassium-efflux system protein KefB